MGKGRSLRHRSQDALPWHLGSDSPLKAKCNKPGCLDNCGDGVLPLEMRGWGGGCLWVSCPLARLDLLPGGAWGDAGWGLVGEPLNPQSCTHIHPTSPQGPVPLRSLGFLSLRQIPGSQWKVLTATFWPTVGPRQGTVPCCGAIR